jgi:hypothetical protein
MEKNMDQFHLTDSEPLESFELDEYADQEEIMHAIKETLERELYKDREPGLQTEAPAYFWHTHPTTGDRHDTRKAHAGTLGH